MAQEDKDLLLKDLCARIPYGVKVHTWYNKPMDVKCTGVDVYTNTVNLDIPNDDDAKVYIENVKPYLRPMSSMTEDEKETYYNLCYEEEREELEFGEWAARIHYHDTIDSIDYLNSIHIDYRGHIEHGLAIEVIKENNPYKS